MFRTCCITHRETKQNHECRKMMNIHCHVAGMRFYQSSVFSVSVRIDVQRFKTAGNFWGYQKIREVQSRWCKWGLNLKVYLLNILTSQESLASTWGNASPMKHSKSSLRTGHKEDKLQSQKGEQASEGHSKLLQVSCSL